MGFFYVVAEKLVQKKMEEIHNKVDLSEDVEGAYLTHLLLSEKMTVTEILGSITELLLAGVDTVRTQGGGGGSPGSGLSPWTDPEQATLFCFRPPTPSPGLCTCWPRIQTSKTSCTGK